MIAVAGLVELYSIRLSIPSDEVVLANASPVLPSLPVEEIDVGALPGADHQELQKLPLAVKV